MYVVTLRVVFALTFLTCCGVAPFAAYASEGGGHEAKKEAQSEAKSKKKEAASITGGQYEGDPVYLHLAPLILPVINDYGAQQIVTMLVDLHIKNREKAEEMQKQMPKIKDAMLQGLYGSLSDGSVRNGNALDIIKIKDNLQTTLNRVFEEGAVEEVLIQAVSQKKL